MNLSAEERAKLANQFRNEVQKVRATQLGVTPDEVTLRVVNGKYDWARRADVRTQLEKQRQLAVVPRTSRALRGEDSLVSRIRAEVIECMDWLEKLTLASAILSAEKKNYIVRIQEIEKHTENTASKLGEIEESIESFKKADSIFAQAEGVFLQMRHAKEENNLERFQEIREANQELLIRYETSRDRLEPLINSARVLRLEIQKEYWQILNIRWSLQNLAIDAQMDLIHDQAREYSPESRKRLYLIDKGDVRTLLEAIMQREQELSLSRPAAQADVLAANKSYDTLLSNYQSLLNLQFDIYSQLLKRNGSIGENSIIPKVQPSSRMAYSSRSNRKVAP